MNNLTISAENITYEITEKLLYKQSLNIYTDTSEKELIIGKDKIKVQCCGFIVTNRGQFIDCRLEIWIDEPTIFGEARGIAMAYEWLVNNYTKYYYSAFPFNIFTDSSAAQANINNQLIHWFYDLNDADRFYVINSYYKYPWKEWKDITYNVAKDILKTRIPVRIFWVAGHVPIYKQSFMQSDYDKFKSKFNEINSKYHGDLTNDIEDDNIVYEMATFNNMIDLYTRNFLIRNINTIHQQVQDNYDMIKKSLNSVSWPFYIPNNNDTDYSKMILSLVQK